MAQATGISVEYQRSTTVGFEIFWIARQFRTVLKGPARFCLSGSARAILIHDDDLRDMFCLGYVSGT